MGLIFMSFIVFILFGDVDVVLEVSRYMLGSIVVGFMLFFVYIVVGCVNVWFWYLGGIILCFEIKLKIYMKGMYCFVESYLWRDFMFL